MTPLDHIRNFCIIAHIDHGKSTLADRILEYTGLVSDREARDQYLDKMDLERERGITIKAQTVRIPYTDKDGRKYVLNLIDTPGHVDFNYEVSRSLAACDGALLVVDATQGVEAQTLANVYLALDENLEILPVLNKIDLPSARPEETKQEIEEVIGLDAEDAPLISAKEGIGIEELLERIVSDIPAPSGDPHGKLKALIFDSKYDNYKGVVIYTRVFDGQVARGDVIRLMNTGKKYEVTEVGMCVPGPVPTERLRAGEVGYICGSIKQVSDARVGDTITLESDPAAEMLPGLRDAPSARMASPRRWPLFKTLRPNLVMVLFSSISGITSPTVPIAARSSTSVSTDLGRPAVFCKACATLKATPQPASSRNG